MLNDRRREAGTKVHTVLKLRMYGAVSPLFHASFQVFVLDSVKGQLQLHFIGNNNNNNNNNTSILLSVWNTMQAFQLLCSHY